MMFNYDIQNAIVAFVDSIRPMGDAQAALYESILSQFANAASGFLTSIGYPPR
jgi:hypothetical protein